MNLYKENNKYLDVYEFVPDKLALIEFKKKYLEYIKSITLHINNEITFEVIDVDNSILFYYLDAKEKNQKITYIEDNKNQKIINNYIYGKYDSNLPVTITGCPGYKTRYSDVENQDYRLLYTYAHSDFKDKWVVDEAILLEDILNKVQPLLATDIFYLDDYIDFDNKEVLEFLKIFNCKIIKRINKEKIDFLINDNLITLDKIYYKKIENSNKVLDAYRKVKKI